MSISFIYFDVGGVAIRDFSGTNKWEEMKQDMGVSDNDSEAFRDLFDQYDLNTFCDVDSLIPIFSERFHLQLPGNYSWVDDFIDRFEQNQPIWPIINKAKSKYKIGLLTNMYPCMLNKINKANLLPIIEWDVIVDSSVIKMCKPNKDIYEYAQGKAAVNPENILFIDNTAEHLKVPSDLGWQTLLYDPKNIESSNSKLAEII